MVMLQILLNGAEPCDAGTTQLSSPVCRSGGQQDPLSICVVVHALMGTLKPHSNGPLYKSTVVGTLAVDGLLHLVQRRGAWADCGPAQSFLAVPNVTAHP